MYSYILYSTHAKYFYICVTYCKNTCNVIFVLRVCVYTLVSMHVFMHICSCVYALVQMHVPQLLLFSFMLFVYHMQTTHFWLHKLISKGKISHKRTKVKTYRIDVFTIAY